MQTELFNQRINEFRQVVPNAFICYDDNSYTLSAQQLINEAEITAEDKIDLTLTKICQGKLAKSKLKMEETKHDKHT